MLISMESASFGSNGVRRSCVSTVRNVAARTSTIVVHNWRSRGEVDEGKSRLQCTEDGAV